MPINIGIIKKKGVFGYGRYIDALRTAGADIEYENKGWHCKIAIWDY